MEDGASSTRGDLGRGLWGVSKISELVQRHQASDGRSSSNLDFVLLDEILMRALAPLEYSTEAYREWLAEVAAYTIMSRRRDNNNLVVECVAGLFGACDSRIGVVTAGIDRAHVFSFLQKAVEASNRLEAAQVAYLRHHGKRVSPDTLETIRATKNALGHSSHVVPAVRTAAYWYDLACKHKSRIISYYMRLLYKVSSRSSVVSGNRVEADVAFGDAYVTASNAVDRFRSDRGVFASYLGICLKGSNRESAANALGLATPGARVLSHEANQADDIEGAMSLSDSSKDAPDYSVLSYVDAIARDPDVRVALMLSDIEPSAVRSKQRSQRGEV